MFTYRGIGKTAKPSRPKKGGGIRTVVSRPDNKPEQPEYTSKIEPIPLRLQYDALLESGEISEEEWVGVMMLYGVDPVPLVSA